MEGKFFFVGAGLVLFILMIPALVRVVFGPTPIDRIVGVNVIGTKTAVLLVIIGTIYGRVEMFVDFALAYALLNFVGSLAASRFLHKSEPEGKISDPFFEKLKRILKKIFSLFGIFDRKKSVTQ